MKNTKIRLNTSIGFDCNKSTTAIYEHTGLNILTIVELSELSYYYKSIDLGNKIPSKYTISFPNFDTIARSSTFVETNHTAPYCR